MHAFTEFGYNAMLSSLGRNKTTNIPAYKESASNTVSRYGTPIESSSLANVACRFSGGKQMAKRTNISSNK